MIPWSYVIMLAACFSSVFTVSSRLLLWVAVIRSCVTRSLLIFGFYGEVLMSS